MSKQRVQQNHLSASGITMHYETAAIAATRTVRNGRNDENKSHQSALCGHFFFAKCSPVDLDKKGLTWFSQ